MRYNFRKKFIPAFLCLILVAAAILLPYGSTDTGLENAEVLSFLKKDIYINGVRYDNYRLQQPFAVTGGSTFVPMTEEVMAALGFELSCGEEIVELKEIEPAEIKMADKVVNNLKSVMVDSCDAVSVSIVDEFTIKKEARFPKLSEAVQKVKERFGLDSENMLDRNVSGSDVPTAYGDLYRSGDCYYIKLSCLTTMETLPLSAYYDSISGLYLSTDAAFPAANYYSKTNSDYISGRAAYMKSCNRGLTDEEARTYEYYFRHEAFNSGVSEDLLMAICKTESDYRMDIAGRAIGLMQLMPSTVTGAGWDVTDVSNPHGNIEFGAIYIADRLKRYAGNEVTALSAYNQGIGAVSSGNYSTAYAYRVIGFKSSLQSWCKSKGYGNTFSDRVEAQ